MSSTSSSCYTTSDEIDERYQDYIKQFRQISDLRLLCNICGEDINNASHSVASHVENSQQHQNKFDSLLEDNDIEETNKVIYYCNLCNMYTNNLLQHIEKNTDHINWRWITGDIDKKTLKHYIYYDNTNSAEAQKYEQIYNTLLKRNAVNKLNAVKFHCVPCNLPLTSICEIDHMFGERHKSGLAQFQLAYKI